MDGPMTLRYWKRAITDDEQARQAWMGYVTAHPEDDITRLPALVGEGRPEYYRARTAARITPSVRPSTKRRTPRQWWRRKFQLDTKASQLWLEGRRWWA